MNSMIWILLILTAIILLILIWHWLKPYIIRHDTTITICGGLGSGKTCEATKLGIVLLRKNIFIKYKCYNFWKVKVVNFFRKIGNKSRAKKGKVQKALLEPRKRPRLYANYPIWYKKHFWSREREWAEVLTERHVMLLKEITEYSIVIIDEFPQFIQNTSWKEEVVQNNLNEFITFFRHYIAGYILITSQSIQEVECHFRRKLNQAIFCFNFRKWPFNALPLFYTVRMCDIMINDSMQTVSTSYIEENTKLHFGLFPPKNTYDTRCYSIRYKNMKEPAAPRILFNQLKTMKVLRIKDYISPLDECTTAKEKQRMLEKILEMERSARITTREDINNEKASV